MSIKETVKKIPTWLIALIASGLFVSAVCVACVFGAYHLYKLFG